MSERRWCVSGFFLLKAAKTTQRTEMNNLINVDNGLGSDTAGLLTSRYFILFQDGCYQNDVIAQAALLFLLYLNRLHNGTDSQLKPYCLQITFRSHFVIDSTIVDET